MISHDLFQWGQLRQTLLIALLRDLSLKGAKEGILPKDAEHLLDDPIFSGAVDESFLQRLLEDVKGRYSGVDDKVQMLYASLSFKLAQEHRSPLAPDFLLVWMASAMYAGIEDEAERAARLGIDEFGEEAAPQFLSRCHDILGRAFYDRGDYLSAIPIFEAGSEYAHAAGDDFGEWDRLTNAVACYQLLGRYLESLDYIKRAETIARKIHNLKALTKSLIDRGNTELNLERIDRAERTFMEALKVAEETKDELSQSNCLGNIGNIYYIKGKLPGAEEYHRRALEISRRIRNEESEQLDLNNLAQTLWEGQKRDESVQFLIDAIHIAERRGDSRSIHRYREGLRDRYIAMGYYQKARAVDELISPTPKKKDVKETSDKEKSKDTSDDAVIEGYALEAAFNERMRSGDKDGARLLVDDFIAKRPDNWIGYFMLGLFLNETGQFQDSIQAYQHALILNPRSIEIHYNMLNSWNSLGDLQSQLTRYERMVQDSPFDPVLRTALGRAYGMAGLHDEAIRHLKEAVRRDPQSYMARLTLSQELFFNAMSLLQANWNAAWSCFEECSNSFMELLNLDKKRLANSYTIAAECFENMAVESQLANPPLLVGLGDRELMVLCYAVSFYRKAAELAPHLNRPREGYTRALEVILQLSDAKGLTEAAAIMRDSGRGDDALQILELSIELDPNLPRTYYELSLLHLHRSVDKPYELIQAKDAIQKAIVLDPDNPDYTAVLHRINHKRTGIKDQLEGSSK